MDQQRFIYGFEAQNIIRKLNAIIDKLDGVMEEKQNFTK